MELSKNELAVEETTKEPVSMLSVLTSTTQSFCTLVPKTEEEQMLMFNIMNQPDKKLADCINMDIELANVYAEIVEVTDEQTGEVEQAPRIVLIDKDNVSYQTVSKGILNTLAKIFQVFGTPDKWSTPKTFTVKQKQGKGNNKFLTLELKNKSKK